VENQFAFHAGSLFKVFEKEKLNSIRGRVILLIECVDESGALEMRKQLANDSRLIFELISTIQPWPTNIVTVNSVELNNHVSIREVFDITNDDG